MRWGNVSKFIYINYIKKYHTMAYYALRSYNAHSTHMQGLHWQLWKSNVCISGSITVPVFRMFSPRPPNCTEEMS